MRPARLLRAVGFPPGTGLPPGVCDSNASPGRAMPRLGVRPVQILLLLIVFGCVAVVRAASPPGPSAEISPGLADRVPDLARRLTALAPANPRAYFELGEEVGSEAADATDRRLARQLHALAFELIRTPGRASQAVEQRAGAEKASGRAGGHDRDNKPVLAQAVRAVQSGAALALAELAEAPGERRWLLAMAGSVGTVSVSTDDPAVDEPRSEQDPAALEAATVLDMSRNGDGRRASRLLEKPEVAAALARYARLLDPSGLNGGLDRVRRRIAEWPICSECKNRRFVKGPEGVRLCGTCGGRPGPRVSQEELIEDIRTESALLRGSQHSWAAQVIFDAGAPLRDPDLAEIAATYGVDAARPLWREGTWVSAQPAPNPAPPAEPNSTD